MAQARLGEYWLNLQFRELSSYVGRNNFYHEIEIRDCPCLCPVTITPEIKADLKEFANRVLPYFNKYDIPRLKCESLGYHLKNLSSFIFRLTRVRTNQLKRTNGRVSRFQGKMPPSIELTREQELVEVYIERVIMNELKRFKSLNDFLYKAFSDYFKHIRDSLWYIGVSKPYTIGNYLKQVARCRRERELELFSSKCIKRIKEELGKYVHF